MILICKILNTETEKSEQILFVQISRTNTVCSDFSVSILRFFTVCTVQHSEDFNTKLGLSELSSF